MTDSIRPGSPARQNELRSWLEQQIAEGEIQPGESIDEEFLRKRFGVSRTPVREALLQLESMGLVEFRSRQGAVVAQMSVRQIAAMWEVLANLEGLCAALSARRMTPEDIDHLRAIHERSEQFVESRDARAYAVANTAFHEALYAGCRNDYLSDQVKNIRNRMNAYRRFPFEKAGGIERSFLGHQSVLEAVAAGRSDEADIAMRAHVTSATSFLDVIAELPEILAKDLRHPPRRVLT
jgi:DNA-binding GntR family transcriptional regulator